MSTQQTRPDSTSARRGRQPLQVGSWTLFPELGVIRRHAIERPLTGKALHVLLVLIDAGESAVSRDELLDQVWGENYPADGVVSRAIADIRSAFGESAGESNYIRTLPKYGYQLVAERGPVVAPADSRFRIGRSVLISAMLLAVAAIIASIASIKYGTQESQQTTLRLADERPLTSGPGLEHQPRIVSGGEWVVYAALRPGQNDWDLFRASTKDGVTQSIAATPGVHEHGPAVSPEGDEVAYARLRGNTCEVVAQSITFGVPRHLAHCTAKFPTLVDWSADGKQIAFTGVEDEDTDGYRRLYLLDLETGDRQQLSTAVSPTGTDFYPRFSPSGHRVAFLRGEPQPDHRTSLWYVDIQSGIETRVTAQPAQLGGMTWLDDTTLLYSINEAGQFRLHQLNTVTGASAVVEEKGLIHPEFLPAGGLFVAAARRSERDLVAVSNDHSPAAIASSTSDDHDGVFSPDESLVAFISRRSGYDELWIVDVKQGATRRLTRFDGATVRYPSWHPTGRRILFTVQTDNGERLYEVDVISGELRQLEPTDIESTMPSWLDDGQRWVFGCKDGSGWGVCLISDEGLRKIADGYFRPTTIGSELIALVDAAGVLSTLSLADGSIEQLWDGLPNEGRSGWALDAQFLIYAVPGVGAGVGQIRHRDMNSGTESILFEGAMPLVDAPIDIGPLTGAVLFTRHQAASDDLVIFEGELAAH